MRSVVQKQAQRQRILGHIRLLPDADAYEHCVTAFRALELFQDLLEIRDCPLAVSFGHLHFFIVGW